LANSDYLEKCLEKLSTEKCDSLERDRGTEAFSSVGEYELWTFSVLRSESSDSNRKPLLVC